MTITASAPGKQMLTGSYAVVHGRPAVVTAVEQRLYVRVKKNGKDVFRLDAPDLGLSAYSQTINDLGREGLPKGVRFVEVFYRRFLEEYPQQEGIDVVTRSDFAATVGFGSSSAVTVAFGRALMEVYGLGWSKKELFDWCYRVVSEVQGVGSGFDLAAAIWGGTLLYVTPAKIVEKIEVDELPMVVGYSGDKADTATLVRMVNEKMERNEKKIGGIFDGIGELSERMKKGLVSKNWVEVGRVLNEHHELTRKLGVSTEKLERMIRAAREAGALGAALTGAGGGDCMVAVYGKELSIIRKRMGEAIEEAGGEVIEVGLNAEGVRVEEGCQ